MKNKLICFIMLFLVSSILQGQNKEKIKGSKIVTIAVKEVENFDAIDIGDNLEVFLVKGDKNSIEIEADDNLHEIIVVEILAGVLKLSTTKEVLKANKFSVRINYTNTLKMVTVKEKATLNALAELSLENITIKNFDASKSFLNVKSNQFSLFLNDKSSAELNAKTTISSIELSKNSNLKALINSPELKLDMYQKSKASIEGEISKATIRLDNNANLSAKKMPTTEMTLATESYSSCEINVKDKISISATGKSKIELLGDAKVELPVFRNNAKLEKIEK